jgi:hypothetical protein
VWTDAFMATGLGICGSNVFTPKEIELEWTVRAKNERSQGGQQEAQGPAPTAQRAVRHSDG